MSTTPLGQTTNMEHSGRLIASGGQAVAVDRVGSIRARAEVQMYAAVWVERHKYYPYGEENPATVSNREKYATYQRDQSTNLDYAMNRYYAWQHGRFLTPDPYKASAGLTDPGSWNRYVYVLGDPVNWLDPRGLEAVAPGFYWNSPPGQASSGPPLGGGGGDPLDRPPVAAQVGIDAPLPTDGSEQGGGTWSGYNGPLPRLAGTYSSWQVEALAAAWSNAVDRLNDRDCLGLFGDGSAEALATVTFRLLPLGMPRVVNGSAAVIGAATVRESNEIWINVQGPMFNQNVYVPEAGRFAYFDFGTGLNGANWGALLLLHEVGHLVGVFAADASDPKLNRSHTQAVLDSCFKHVGEGLYR